MDKTLLWVWLTSKFQISGNKISHLWETFGDIEKIFSEEEFKNITWLSEREKNILRDKDLARAREISLLTKKMGARIVTYDDEIYPNILKNISDPPFVLYIKGKYINMDKALGIAVVGTRKCSKYGVKVTFDLCLELAAAGAVIISGLARGIDSVANSTAVNSGGATVGVLGCGLDVIYPPENKELYEKVSGNGMLITEYPPKTPAYPGNFPRRNRIIAGLARGIVVTEAPIKSGALITAGQAMENGRDVFAVPRNADNNYGGTNRLIQQGAKLVSLAKDILEDYPYLEKTLVPIKTPKYKKGDAFKIEEPKPQKEKNLNTVYKERYSEIYNKCDDTQKKIIEYISEEEINMDEIVRKCGLDVQTVSTSLIMMEMKGIVKKCPGNNYVIKL